ncbi:MAG: hypothetical protein JRG81_00065 [Deltaproteobacteria bacterium]|nr:hypothetical protein [Deltaproteobacteria bacterium]MBW2363471.1 hypothetical protein [Deltaproteobacteria bacterium]
MIKRLNHNEIKEIYPKLYFGCFDKQAPILMPPVMLTAEDEFKTYGFTAGFSFNSTTIYINATGMLPEYRTKKRAAQINKEFHQTFKKMGAKHLMGHIENKNKKALFTALLSGYLITGFRTASDGKQYLIITQKL